MTTAARPTWAPAKGGQEQGGTRIYGTSQKFSARDLPSHTILKTRKEGQGTVEELQGKDLLSDLEDRERKYFESKAAEAPPLATGQLLLQGSGGGGGAAKSIDADDTDDDDGGGSDEDEDDEDEDAVLLAELEKVKKEQAAEKAKRERERQMEDAKAKEAELIRGNPLLNAGGAGGGGGGGSFAVKRRWDDDVVFKNQARGEPKQVKRFVNDTIRSDFHRKFLSKYMK